MFTYEETWRNCVASNIYVGWICKGKKKMKEIRNELDPRREVRKFMYERIGRKMLTSSNNVSVGLLLLGTLPKIPRVQIWEHNPKLAGFPRSHKNEKYRVDMTRHLLVALNSHSLSLFNRIRSIKIEFRNKYLYCWRRRRLMDLSKIFRWILRVFFFKFFIFEIDESCSKFCKPM